MFGFLIKKWFFDLWDNLLVTLIINVIFGFALFGFGFLTSVVGSASAAFGVPLFIVAVLLIYIFLAIANGYTLQMAKGERMTWADIPGHFRRGGVQGFVFGVLQIVVFTLCLVALRYYGPMTGALSVVLMIIVFWALVFWALITQYYFPINAQLDTKIFKIIRKSAIVFMDNTPFTIGLAAGSIVIIILSTLTLSLFPGVTGLLLWHQVAFKLRLYKYDYLEKHPDTPTKEIPWDMLIKNDRDNLGPRSFRSLFFPWKE